MLRKNVGMIDRPVDFNRLVTLIEAAHDHLWRRAAEAVNQALVIRNWLIGGYIVEYEQHGKDRAKYGDRLIRTLAGTFTEKGMKGFSYRSLELFKKFYQSYQDIVQTVSADSAIADIRKSEIVQTVSAQLMTTPDSSIPESLAEILSGRFKLTWSHYVFLIQIDNDEERRFYEIESAGQRWSFREMKRQFDSSLYERLALSRNRDKVRSLGARGHVIVDSSDVVKDPYVLEFLGLPEHPAYSETDLERAIINKIEQFLLELGKGFLFEARQKRITFDEEHYFVDLVFYNRLLRCYVLVDLKIGKLTHQDLGQMQMYVNYFDRHIKLDDENPTIGILICKTKNDALVEMTLPKGNRTVFASRYQLYLPSKAELRRQLRAFITGVKECN